MFGASYFFIWTNPIYFYYCIKWMCFSQQSYQLVNQQASVSWQKNFFSGQDLVWSSIFSSNLWVIDCLFEVPKTYLELTNLPTNRLQQAIVVIEDQNWFNKHGYNLHGGYQGQGFQGKDPSDLQTYISPGLILNQIWSVFCHDIASQLQWVCWALISLCRMAWFCHFQVT